MKEIQYSREYGRLLEAAANEEEQTYINLLVIRRFEENLLHLFGENKLFGTTHTCIGQEAVAIGVMSAAEEGDVVFSNHRCHGHFIAYSHHPELLLKEIMGKKHSLCDGRGGSQHIQYQNFFTNGVQGGIVPNAVGAALSQKRKRTDHMVFVFLGDGTLGQGIVYESMNLAALLEVPVLFVVENNGYAMSTKTSDAVSGRISDRALAFGIEASEVDGNDVEAVTDKTKSAVEYVRGGKGPFMLVCNTYRLAAHSKGDDFRPSEEISEHKKQDPILLYAQRFEETRKKRLDLAVDAYIDAITKEAEDEEYSVIDELPVHEKRKTELNEETAPNKKRYLEYINFALREALKDKDTILLGEDIRDPYGGAFKVTKGISSEYPDQVYNMPISEAAITGIAVGAALNGTRTIAEIMFGDFVTLAFDQLLNHASKYGWVYQKNVPMILRTPMGGKRGYGPTHSQCLEKYLVGMPDVNVAALSIVHNPVNVYRMLLAQNNPSVVIENKLLYTKPFLEPDSNSMVGDFYAKSLQNHLIPTIVLGFNPDFSNDVSLITYGGMVNDCIDAAKILMIEDEIAVNIAVIGQLSEFPVRDMEEMGGLLGAVMTVEEGTFSYGIGAEIISRLSEKGIGTKYMRIAAPDMPIPNSLILEKELLPCTDTVVRKVRTIIYGK